ncbi:winged helix-turn-helix domain-containing protein [Bradyrhizobium sp. STM 3562]|uniref:winged helix-turn-helix domain-containing protein n=1 Tax=Bradyrhizobium sp. STM 3562 TaxID=578924 RepID=UPI00388E6F4B
MLAAQPMKAARLSLSLARLGRIRLDYLVVSGGKKLHPLSQREARRIWLRAQRLDTAAPFGAGARAVADAVAHLGYVQIDTINVIERCHHHILWTRIPEYRRADLRQAQSVDKSVFEYWTHALSYIPSRDLRFFIPLMRLHKRERERWFEQVTPQDLRKVMRLIRQGPLTIRDIDDDVLVEKEHLWASRKPSKRALQFAFYTGALAISERNGMLKTYELIGRHFGWDKPPKAASAPEVAAYLLDRALRSQGLVSLDSICHLDAPSKPGVRRVIEACVRRGELVPVMLEGAGKQEHWARPELLEEKGEGGPELVHILSPFDPLIIQRKRTRLFFGYEHRFEAYVPKHKRQFGYFALPVLVDDDIVAAIDLKTDRQNRELLLQKWSWVGVGAKRGARGELKRRIEEALGRFERFQLGD